MKKQSNREAYEKRKATPKPMESSVSLQREETTSTEDAMALSAKKSKPTGTVKRKQRGSHKGVIITICILLVAATVGAFAWVYMNYHEAQRFSAVFAVDSATVTMGTGGTTMDHTVFIDEGTAMVSMNGMAKVLPVTVKWDGKSKKATMTGNGVKLEVTAKDPVVLVNDKEETWNHAPMIKDKEMFLPLASLGKAFGYEVAYDKENGNIFVVLPHKNNTPPVATLTTDKDVYKVGEAVTFAVEVDDADGDEVVIYQWGNYYESYKAPGQYEVTLMVMDERGSWSKEISKTLVIEAE